jgi:hypothetical protein
MYHNAWHSWFLIELIWFWESYINRIFSTSPTQAGKPTQKMPNCSMIWHSWVVRLGWGWSIISSMLCCPRGWWPMLQSISYQTQSSRLLFITGYVWAVNCVKQRTSKGYITIGLQAEKKKKRTWEITKGHSCQVRQLGRFQVLPSTALNTQVEEEPNKFSSTRVHKAPGRPQK